jgi:hypothetical protein
MGITRFYDNDREYYRVTRSWNKVMRQQYVAIEKNRHAAYKKAMDIDARLKVKQKAFENLMAISKEGYFREDGSIIGISKYVNRRAGRKEAQYFRLQMTLEAGEKPQRFSANIDKLGLAKAHKKVVDCLCEWKGIEKRTDLYAALIEGVDFYKEPDKKSMGENTALLQLSLENKSNALSNMESKLKAQAQDFQKRRHCIRG